MTHRIVTWIGVGAIAVVALALIVLVGRSPSDGAKPPAGTQTWTPSRTPDGQPDLQGTWLNYEATPFEAPQAAPAPVAADTPGRARGAPIFGRGAQRGP